MLSNLSTYIKNFLNNLYINYTYRQIISKSDKKEFSVNKELDNNSYINDLYNNGVIKIENLGIDESQISEYYHFLLDNLNNDSKIRNYSHSTVNKKDSIVEKILLDKNLNNIIKSYLGENACLDNVVSLTTNASSLIPTISEKWHWDNVGRRLKMFFYLNNNNNISTDYITTTNRLSHFFYSTRGSRVKDSKIKKLKDNIKFFFPKKDSLIIFDTNGIHKGNFSRQSNTLEENFRAMIKFEFSSKVKSDMFYKKSNIIGPRFTFFSHDFDIDNCDLINKECLSKIDDLYYYDNEFSKEFE